MCEMECSQHTNPKVFTLQRMFAKIDLLHPFGHSLRGESMSFFLRKSPDLNVIIQDHYWSHFCCSHQ